MWITRYFMIFKTSFQNISKTLLRQLWQVKTPLSDFFKKTPGKEKHKDK